MASVDIIKKAQNLLAKKQYAQAGKLLEPHILSFQNSFLFHYTLAVSFLYLGDIGGAELYFKKARNIKMQDVNLILGQACIFLRKGQVDRAIEYCVEALGLEPENRYAKRFLNLIKEYGDKETLSQWIFDGRIKKYYPPLPKRNFVPHFLFGFLVLSILGFLSFFIFQNFNTKPELRADLSALNLTLEEKANSLEKDIGTSVYRYILTMSEVEKSYKTAQEAFQKNDDTKAQIEINRILHSNASFAIKQKAQLLMEYLSEPTFDSLKTSLTYADIVKDPYLHLDCWVRWGGRLSNLNYSETQIEAQLLLGYEDMKKIEGFVPVIIPANMQVDDTRALEVLGKIELKDSIMVLRVKSIYQSIHN